jgi:pimeloyl-ACP methyl ester carboxylesterase
LSVLDATMSAMKDFTEDTVRGMHVVAGGDGYPVLLLHGFPQTHLAWRRVAPVLAKQFRVICPDLPGYGASAAPMVYSKRATADAMVAMMRDLGHERFAVAGHDRGALVAFRAALDHGQAVERVCVIDVIPSVDLWASLAGAGGVFAAHLYFLAQPGDLPERMIAADPDTFFGHFLDMWAADEDTVPADVRAEYLAASAASIHAICEDYRAGAFTDPAHDAADQEAGRRIAAPTVAIWQDPGAVRLPFDPEAVWRSWAPDLRPVVLPGGHFLPESRPADVAAAITALVAET